jgi:tetratricopeptide (TPR) repeat protein
VQGQGLLERDIETAAIDRVLAGAAAGRGSVVVVEGPAGIGKTSVLAAGARAAVERGMQVLRATGAELERSFAFGVARQLFERPLAELSARRRARVLSGAAGPATGVLGLGGGWDIDVHAAVHSLYWLAANLAAEASLLLVVDDAHWGDAASLHFLNYLARRIDELPVALLVGTRSPEQRSATAALESLLPLAHYTFRPAPLSDHAVADIAARTLGTRPDPKFVAACEQSTGGNALYVTELLRTLAADHVAPSAAAVPAVLAAAPDAVRRRVAASLASLPPATQRLGRAVAVLDRADLPVAAALAGLKPAAALTAAGALDRAGLLASGRELRFTHPVIANAVELTMSESDRSDQHARAARLLAESGATIDAAAGHLLATRPAGDPWVVQTLRDAARAALSRGGAEEAVAYLRRALDEPPAAELARTLLELGRAEQAVGDLEASRQALEQALATEPDLETDDELRVELSHTLFLSGDYDAATTRLLEIRPTPDDEARTRAIDGNLLALCLLDPERRPLIAERLERYRLQALAGTLDDPILLTIVGGVSVMRGEPRDEGLRLVRRALDGHGLSAFGDETFALGWAAAALSSSDGEAEMLVHIDRALAETRRRGERTLTAYLLSYRSWCLYGLGRLPESEAAAHSCSDLLGGPDSFVHFPFSLLDTLIERDRLAEAEAMLAQIPFMGSPQRDAILKLMHGRVAVAAGRHADALPPLLEAGAVLDSLELRHPKSAPWRYYAAVAARHTGDRELAERLADEGLAISRRTGTPTTVMRALRALAIVRPELAVEALAETAEPARETADLVEGASALTAYGSALAAAGRTEEAKDRLREALAIAHTAGAMRLESEARRELVALGGRPRRHALTGVDALTPSELQTARLAAEGLTNREIAQALFVTLKTVERHLNRSYGKLGIAGRRELAGALEKRLG